MKQQNGSSMQSSTHESGMVLVVLVAALLPLIALVGASTMSMGSRNSRLLDEIAMERALMAAESGIDEAVYLGQIGSLSSGVNFERDLGHGMRAFIEPSYLKTDGLDNDGDGNIDEVDETIFRLIVTGFYRERSRKIVAYVGPTQALPDLTAAATVAGDVTTAHEFEVEVEDFGVISGVDVTPPDVPVIVGAPLADTAGVKIAPPNALSDLSGALDIKDSGQILGTGGPPSIGMAPSAIDIESLVNSVRSMADTVLLQSEYENADLGNASTGDYRIIFRKGELELEKGGRGAGIMVVLGELEIEDTFRFDGVIIVFGECEIEDNAVVNGAVLVVPGSEGHDEGDHSADELELEVEGNGRIQYSSELVKQMQLLLPGSFIVFNGWQEVSRN